MTYAAIVAAMYADCSPDRERRLDAHYAAIQRNATGYLDGLCAACGHHRSSHINGRNQCLVLVCRGCWRWVRPEREGRM